MATADDSRSIFACCGCLAWQKWHLSPFVEKMNVGLFIGVLLQEEEVQKKYEFGMYVNIFSKNCPPN